MSYAGTMAGKRGTLPGDVVLVHYQGKPASFARVENVRPHPRPGWFFCDLLVLAVPAQPVTWILERTQIDGVEFTMGGRPVRLEKLPELGAIHDTARAKDAKDAAHPAGAEEASTPETRAHEPTSGERGSRSPVRRPAEARGDNVVRLFPRK